MAILSLPSLVNREVAPAPTRRTECKSVFTKSLDTLTWDPSQRSLRPQGRGGFSSMAVVQDIPSTGLHGISQPGRPGPRGEQLLYAGSLGTSFSSSLFFLSAPHFVDEETKTKRDCSFPGAPMLARFSNTFIMPLPILCDRRSSELGF